MLLELAQLAEAAATERTAVRPLARVDALVLMQTVQVTEAFLAVAAWVRSLACMDALVRLQAVEAPEASATNITAVHFVSAVPLDLCWTCEGDVALYGWHQAKQGFTFTYLGLSVCGGHR